MIRADPSSSLQLLVAILTSGSVYSGVNPVFRCAILLCSSLLPASVGALTAAQLMSGLPDAVCGVWDFNQTAAFASPKCQHLGMFCLQNWMADSMGGFTADCVGGMTVRIWTDNRTCS